MDKRFFIVVLNYLSMHIFVIHIFILIINFALPSEIYSVKSYEKKKSKLELNYSFINNLVTYFT